MRFILLLSFLHCAFAITSTEISPLRRHQRKGAIMKLLINECATYYYDHITIKVKLGKQEHVAYLRIPQEMSLHIALVVLHTVHIDLNQTETTMIYNDTMQIMLRQTYCYDQDATKHWSLVTHIWAGPVTSDKDASPDGYDYHLFQNTIGGFKARKSVSNTFDDLLREEIGAVARGFIKFLRKPIRVRMLQRKDCSVLILIDRREDCAQFDLKKELSYGAVAALAQILHSTLKKRYDLWFLHPDYMVKTKTLHGVVEIRETDAAAWNKLGEIDALFIYE